MRKQLMKNGFAIGFGRAGIAAGMLAAGALGLAGTAAAQTIKVGLIEPTSGPAAYDGQSVANGAKLAESQINAAGGVLGRKIELLLQDGKADPAESISAAEKLLDRDKVSALIGAWASSATLAVMPLVQRYQVPLIVETSTSEKITESGNPWVFRTSSNSKIDADVLQPYMVKDLGFKKVAFMAANNDFGRAVVTYWTRALTPQGATIVATEYHKPGETNFSPTLTKIKNSGADTIVITSDVTTASNVIKQSYELGMTGFKRVITSGNPAEAIVKLAGKEASEGMLVQNYWVPYAPPPGEEAASAKFVAAYKQSFPDRIADKYAVSGYDAVQVVAAAVRAAGSSEPAKIQGALRTLKLQALQGQIVFDKQQQARPFQSVSRVHDGTPTVVVKVAQ
jgi:branched-chain amino acid transport system substrate-binding protein